MFKAVDIWLFVRFLESVAMKRRRRGEFLGIFARMFLRFDIMIVFVWLMWFGYLSI